MWRQLIGGQIIAFVIATSSILPSLLLDLGYRAVCPQEGVGYLIQISCLLFTSDRRISIDSCWKPALAGILSFECNYFICESFGRLPPLIARFMLGLSLPLNTIVSFFYWGKSTPLTQLAFVITATIGSLLSLLSHSLDWSSQPGSVLLGVAFSLMGVLLGSISHIFEGSCLGKKPSMDARLRLLGIMGVTGTICSLTQGIALEHKLYEEFQVVLDSKTAVICGIIACGILLATASLGCTVFIHHFSGSLLRLNVATASIYVIMLEWTVLGEKSIFEGIVVAALFVHLSGAIGYAVMAYLDSVRPMQVDESREPILSID